MWWVLIRLPNNHTLKSGTSTTCLSVEHTSPRFWKTVLFCRLAAFVDNRRWYCIDSKDRHWNDLYFENHSVLSHERTLTESFLISAFLARGCCVFTRPPTALTYRGSGWQSAHPAVRRSYETALSDSAGRCSVWISTRSPVDSTIFWFLREKSRK